MLGGRRVTTMLPVVDMPRARRFYEDVLGLIPEGLRPDGPGGSRPFAQLHSLTATITRGGGRITRPDDGARPGDLVEDAVCDREPSLGYRPFAPRRRGRCRVAP